MVLLLVILVLHNTGSLNSTNSPSVPHGYTNYSCLFNQSSQCTGYTAFMILRQLCKDRHYLTQHTAWQEKGVFQKSWNTRETCGVSLNQCSICFTCHSVLFVVRTKCLKPSMPSDGAMTLTKIPICASGWRVDAPPVISLFPTAELSCAIQGTLWFLLLCQSFRAAIEILNPKVERKEFGFGFFS